MATPLLFEEIEELLRFIGQLIDELKQRLSEILGQIWSVGIDGVPPFDIACLGRNGFDLQFYQKKGG